MISDRIQLLEIQVNRLLEVVSPSDARRSRAAIVVDMNGDGKPSLSEVVIHEDSPSEDDDVKMKMTTTTDLPPVRLKRAVTMGAATDNAAVDEQFQRIRRRSLAVIQKLEEHVRAGTSLTPF